jgi:ATP-dependent helicase HepA
MPVRILVDIRGNDLTAEREIATFAGDVEDSTIQRFLERPGFNAGLLKGMIERATEQAEGQSVAIRQAAQEKAQSSLGADLQRLKDLSRLNDNVHPAEINLLEEQIRRTADAIRDSRLRLDSIRLVVEGGSI